jgi:DNA replication licensing factor MCM4
LHREALLQSAVDPETGVVNVNIIAAGISSTSKKVADVIKEKIRHELEQRHATTLSGIKLFREMRQIEKVSLTSNTLSTCYPPILTKPVSNDSSCPT